MLVISVIGSGCLPVELGGPPKIILIVPNADELGLAVLQVGSVGVHSAACLPWKLLKAVGKQFLRFSLLFSCSYVLWCFLLETESSESFTYGLYFRVCS